MEVLQTSRQSQISSTIAYSGSFQAVSAGSLFRAILSYRAANKEVQHVIDTINDGTLYLRDANMSTLQEKGES